MNVCIGITLHKQILKYKNNETCFQIIVKLQGVIFVLYIIDNSSDNILIHQH